VLIETPVRNVNRCVGGMLSSRIAELHGSRGLGERTVEVHFTGSAGQSFGGWLAPGVQFVLHGDANDYTGKGLSGGTVVVRPPDGVTFKAEENVIIGNTVLYGATSGKAFFRGLAGERFAVRNSGANAVIEGVGDHGCEYMTGGRVVVLGQTGRNFAAGMSGGIAYVLDEDGAFRSRVNPTMLNQLEELGDADAAECRALIEEHLHWTASPVAQRVLDDWDAARGRFVKVFPADYKRVLAELAAAEGGTAPLAAVAVEAMGEPHVIGEGN
jgi:glutamate synthase (NADPH/NADH) large chain/glutamate synthase (ferredoxin)